MKNKELYQKLSRLQTRAYNLQSDIATLVGDVARDMEKQKQLLETKGSE